MLGSFTLVVLLVACPPRSLPPDYVSLGPVGPRTPAEQVAFAQHAVDAMSADEATLRTRGQNQDPACVAAHQEGAAALVVEATAAQASLERFVLLGDATAADAEVRALVIAIAAMQTVLDEGLKCPVAHFPPAMDAAEFPTSNQTARRGTRSW